MLGVPPADTLRVSKLIATKVISNGKSNVISRCYPHDPDDSPCTTEFVAFDALTSSVREDPNFLSPRAFLIASYALCGFGNISSAGINIGIMVALAPNRSVDIIQLVPRALIVGIVATLSTASIAGKLIKDWCNGP